MIKLKGLAAEDLNGFMDEGTEFRGELRFRDTVPHRRRASRARIVSEQHPDRRRVGHVDAEIDCGVVSIRGTVSGRVHGRQRIEAARGRQACRHASSRRKLVIEEGAFFQGDCDMSAGLPKPRAPVVPPAPRRSRAAADAADGAAPGRVRA